MLQEMARTIITMTEIVPKVSSPVPAEQVNGVHDSTVEDVPARQTAHAEPNGFEEFDPRMDLYQVLPLL
ncbi:unnamed protein product [Urochloa humidicola]